MDSESRKHPLSDYFADMQQKMQMHYERIRDNHSRRDPGIAGDKGETNWKQLFQDWFPQFNYMTKVSLVDTKGVQSPEVDLVILRPDFPRPLLENKEVIIDAVVAAFECKLTFYATELPDVLKKARVVKEMASRPFLHDAYFLLNGRFPYGLLSHSHEWQRPESKPMENMERNLETSIYSIATHPSRLLDFACIADVATWRTHTMGYSSSRETHITTLLSTYGTEPSTRPAPAIGQLLVWLNHRLGTLGHLEPWFATAVGSSTGVTASMRGNPYSWPDTEFSEDVIAKAKSGELFATEPNEVFVSH